MKLPLNPFRSKTPELPVTLQEVSSGPVFMSDKVNEWRNELRNSKPYEIGMEDAAVQRPERFGKLRIKQAFENQLEHVMDKVGEHQDLLQAHADQLGQPDALAVRDIQRMMEVLTRFLATCQQQRELAAENQGWLADQLEIYSMGYQQSSQDFAS